LLIRPQCQSQASTDLNDAQQTCQEQNDVRLAACDRLGGAPYDPVIDPSNFVTRIDNPYFPLTPGTTFVYEGQTAEGFEHDEFAVTHNTRVILGVTCVEVHDTVTLDGELTEDTLDWFAQDRDGNVWYFGENTHELEDGLITTIDGTFMGWCQWGQARNHHESSPGHRRLLPSGILSGQCRGFRRNSQSHRVRHRAGWYVSPLPEIARDHAPGNRPART
jgi:hypothetical protein